MEELWLNNNSIEEWSNLEYIGSTLKNLRNLYIAVNPVYKRGQEFKEKIKIAIPCLKELEGNPFERPVYMYAPQPGGVMKKGINPKAKAILDDILGKTAADEYKEEHEKENNE